MHRNKPRGKTMTSSTKITLIFAFLSLYGCSSQQLANSPADIPPASVSARASSNAQKSQTVAPATQEANSNSETTSSPVAKRKCEVSSIAFEKMQLCTKSTDRDLCLRKFGITSDHVATVLKQMELCLAESSELLNAEIKKPNR